MSKIDTLSDESEDDLSSDVINSETEQNKEKFQQLIKLCPHNKHLPEKYIKQIIEMYNKCDDKQRNSTHFCNLVNNGVDNIYPNDKHSFQYIAEVYNELLNLIGSGSTSLQNDNCVASTSNGVSSMSTKLQNETNNSEISNSNEIFYELIQKCYENTNFPNSHIKTIEKLYKALPLEFLNSKFFVLLLKESNEKIWPDSTMASYIHMDLIYDQLKQFETSMKIQDRKISIENKEAKTKQLKKMKLLIKAFKKLCKRIKVLDEAEMDINDENEFGVDSAYIVKDKFEKRTVEIYRRICKLREEPDFLEEPKLYFKETNNNLVNKTIEKFFNINKTFPDYFEIYTLLKMLNEKKKLNWTVKQLKTISQDAFLKLGKKLKIRRLNEYFGRLTDIAGGNDPAAENVELKKKLDESNKKLCADLNAVTEKFKDKQDYAEETAGSSLNDTNCENSSDDDSSAKNMNCKLKVNKINPILIKRKRILSSESENELPKKSTKTAYMESFNLKQSSLNKLNNVIDKKTITIDNKTPNKIEVTENINNSYKKLENMNLDQEGSISDTDKDIGLVINEDISCINKNIDETNAMELTNSVDNDINANSTTLGNDVVEPIISESEVIIIESKSPTKEKKEDTNALDDSDVEITACTLPSKIQKRNNKSLESFIKSMKFEKKYNWDQPQVKKTNPPNVMLPCNSNNRWIMNNTQPPPKANKNMSYPKHQTSYKEMQSYLRRSTSQNARQLTHSTLNSIQRQRDVTNNKSVLSQHVTTMTTTTTVHQIVQQQSSRQIHKIVNSSQANNGNKPELIELD